MDSYSQQQQQHQHHFQDLQRQFHHQKQQVNTLTRFRSAPSSYFSTFLDAADSLANGTAAGVGGGGGGGDRGVFSDVRPLSPETENIFARFMSSMDAVNNASSQKLSDIPENSQMQPDLMVTVKQESDTQIQHQQQEQLQKAQQQPQQGRYSGSSGMRYRHSASKPPLANQHNIGGSSSMGMNSASRMKIGIGGSCISNNSSLTRHSSSPAGFFADLDIDGYLKGLGNYGGAGASNDHTIYTSGQPSSSSGLMRQNSDMEGKLMRMNSLEETSFDNPVNNNQNNDTNYGLPISSWDDSIMSETFSGVDRGDEDIKPFSDQNSSDNKSGESRSRLPLLAHHLSLPKTSAELTAMERLLDLHDSVPLRIRAKRGCATHPRSIAERVRRTRISERMRKLQDLVPNMDKQTNTSDMLDLAVDYIKDLQKKVKTLNDTKAKCSCSR